MGIQEVIVFVIVIAAAVYTAVKFIRQFTRGDGSSAKCASCDISKAMEKTEQSN